MFPISDSITTRHTPFVNYALIAVTSFVFIQQIISPNPDAFIQQYGLIPALVNFANPSSLFPFVTAIFLHGGLLHIITNMWFLWVFGDDVEGYYGSMKYLLLYFLSGVAGNVFQYLLIPTAHIPMLGASGGVAGVLGSYFILFPYSKIKTLVFILFFVTVVNISAPFMLGYWFLLQIISGAVALPGSSNSGGIAFFAHVGGFITGVLFARIFSKHQQASFFSS